jgi:5-methylcytosine-specific restriction endonuclease McrA
MLLPKPRPHLLDKRAIAATKERQWRELRRTVLKRDGGLCRVCVRATAMDVHHILFRSLGGKDEARNLIACCKRCHADIHGHVVKLRWRDDANRARTLIVERVA